MSNTQDVDFDPRAMRRRLDLNQQEFWNAVGVTQSGGSRYEQDRRIPKPVKKLLVMRYKYNIDPDAITDENATMIQAILEGKLDTGTLKHQLEKIQRVIKASQQLAHTASELSGAAEAVLTDRTREKTA